MNAPDMTATDAIATATAVSATASEFERLLQRNFTPQDLMQGDNLDRLERIAERMASGRMTVPEYLRGNVGDCMAIAMQAMLWNMDPFAVAQKTHIVNGRLGYEAQLVNAVLQNSGAVRGLPRYEYRGDGNSLECRVGFVPRGESEIVWNEFIKSSDITTKNSPLWKVNPKQQLGYLQVKNWARAFCPGAILGVYTVDELDDMPQIDRSAPAAEPQRPALPPYAQADFDKNLPQWRGIVESGRKTAADLLAMLSTKASFTDEQKAALLKLAPPAAGGAHGDFVDAMDKAEGGKQP